MTGTKINVLLVEDSLLALLVEKMKLERAGCHVEIASSGEEALELCKKNHFHLILMDIGLGAMDGFNVTMKIRTMLAGTVLPIIIALTAQLDEGHALAAKNAGMTALLIKPLADDQIQMILNKYCNVQIST